MNDAEIEQQFLKKFGESIFDYPGAEIDEKAITLALIRGGEAMKRMCNGQGLGLALDPSAAEYVAAWAATAIVSERIIKIGQRARRARGRTGEAEKIINQPLSTA